jgi:hypothetical protein
MALHVARHHFWRFMAALTVALFVSWPLARDVGFTGMSLLSFVCYWGLFASLFEIGAAKARRLALTLIIGVVLAVIAPFVSSITQASSGNAAPYGWVGLSAIFISAAIVAAVYRWRERGLGLKS